MWSWDVAGEGGMTQQYLAVLLGRPLIKKTPKGSEQMLQLCLYDPSND